MPLLNFFSIALGALTCLFGVVFVLDPAHTSVVDMDVMGSLSVLLGGMLFAQGVMHIFDE